MVDRTSCYSIQALLWSIAHGWWYCTKPTNSSTIWKILVKKNSKEIWKFKRKLFWVGDFFRCDMWPKSWSVLYSTCYFRYVSPFFPKFLPNATANPGGHWRVEKPSFRCQNTYKNHRKQMCTYRDEFHLLLQVLSLPFPNFSPTR